MKKRGFTLVELLAVIAILAILVIVAMPNVLGMFNEAKANTFVTEVQKYIDTAKTAFVNDALSNQGKTIYYSSEFNDNLKTSKLDMDGSKDYFIEMDRHGDFKRIVIKDDSFCYDIYAGGTQIKFDDSKSKKISNINKNLVSVSDVWNSEDGDSITISKDGSNFKVKGCEAQTTIEGNEDYDNTEVVKIDDIEYKYLPGMTWGDWAHSKYNTIGEPHFASAGISFVGFSGRWGNYITYNTSFVIRNSDMSIRGVTAQENQQIIVGEEYHFDNSSSSIGGINNTTSYYIIDSWDDAITYDKQKQQIDW